MTPASRRAMHVAGYGAALAVGFVIGARTTATEVQTRIAGLVEDAAAQREAAPADVPQPSTVATPSGGDAAPLGGWAPTGFSPSALRILDDVVREAAPDLLDEAPAMRDDWA